MDCLRVTALALGAVLLLPALTHAQPQPPAQPRTPRTILDLVILLPGGGNPSRAQQWQQVFARMDERVRIKSTQGEEKPEIREEKLGTLREVHVTAVINREGLLVFPGRAFDFKDARKLEEYLNELKTYGAQGAPDNKPLWGLNEPQFNAFFGQVSAKIEIETLNQPLEATLGKLNQLEVPIRMSAIAADYLKQEYGGRVPVIRQEVKGFSTGTGLAIVLNDYGLGFRPLRTPAGTLEVAIDPLRVARQAWPIGWDLKETNQKTAPKLFDLVPVELDKVRLMDVLFAISEQTKIPIRVDYFRIEGSGIDIDNLRVSHKPKQTSWSLALRGVTNPHKLSRRLKIDELGQPLVWITVLVPGQPEE